MASQNYTGNSMPYLDLLFLSKWYWGQAAAPTMATGWHIIGCGVVTFETIESRANSTLRK